MRLDGENLFDKTPTSDLYPWCCGANKIIFNGGKYAW